MSKLVAALQIRERFSHTVFIVSILVLTTATESVNLVSSDLCENAHKWFLINTLGF